VDLRGEWRKLHDEELHHLYPSPNITRIIIWAERETLGDNRNTYRVLVWQSDGKRTLERHCIDGRIILSGS
jgi:hypothetical protein